VKTMFMCTTGSSDPTRASIPLHLAANGSVEVGHEVAVLFVGDGAEVLDQATAERIEGVGVPPLRELLAKLLDHGVPIYV
jgi:predicted peroxiredoxin